MNTLSVTSGCTTRRVTGAKVLWCDLHGAGGFAEAGGLDMLSSAGVITGIVGNECSTLAGRRSVRRKADSLNHTLSAAKQTGQNSRKFAF